MFRVLLVMVLATASLAVEVGDKAPGFAGVTWVNSSKAKAPKVKGFKGKLLLVSFWATDNVQSTLGFSDLQQLLELSVGLKIVTVSYADVKELGKFLQDGDFTVLVGSDPGKAVARTWGVKGWPHAFLVDRKGKVVFAGGPHAAMKELIKILDIEMNSEKLLTEVVAARKKKKRLRRAYDLLAAYGATKFDLMTWAAKLKTDPLPEGTQPEKLTAEAALTAYVEGKSTHALKAAAQKDFNLRGWAQRRRMQLYPLAAGELKQLLKERRYRTVLDALAEQPSASLVGAAGRDRDFAAYCAAAAAKRRLFARKALMIYHWPLRKRVPRDSKRFWSEVSIKAWQEDDNKRMVGVRIGSQFVLGPEMPDYARRCVCQSILMERIGRKTGGIPADLDARVEREVKAILTDLNSRY